MILHIARWHRFMGVIVNCAYAEIVKYHKNCHQKYFYHTTLHTITMLRKSEICRERPTAEAGSVVRATISDVCIIYSSRNLF